MPRYEEGLKGGQQAKRHVNRVTQKMKSAAEAARTYWDHHDQGHATYWRGYKDGLEGKTSDA